MPKQKRRLRVGVPLDPEIHSILDEFAVVTGKTKAAVCEEILVESAPSMVQMTNALRKLDASPARSVREMAEMLDRAVFEAKQVSLDLQVQGKKKAG